MGRYFRSMNGDDLFLFVSHVGEDRATALAIVGELERRGQRCWIAPRNVRPGKPFDDEIADAIDASAGMLLIFSEHCNESPYIRREVTVAGEANKLIIPFRIEDAKPRRGLGVRLADLHWIDAFTAQDQAINEVLATLGSYESGSAAHVFGASETRSDHAKAGDPFIHPNTRATSAPNKPNILASRSIVLRGHMAEVASAEFSSDGKQVATASSDNTARLWNAETGSQIGVLQGHHDAVWYARFSRDGSRIITRCEDKTVGLWHTESGANISMYTRHKDRALSFQFSPDGTRWVTASLLTADIWDAASGAHIAALRGHNEEIMSAVFSPDGQTMLTGSVDRTAMLWDTKVASPVAAFHGHGGPVWSVEFSRDGTRVLTWSGDHTARLWDTSGAAIAVFRAGAARLPAFSPDARRVLVLFDRDIGVWNADTGVQVALLSVHGDRLAAAEFSPDASRVVTRADETEIWEVDSGARVAVLRGHTDTVTGAKFSPDGLHVITTSVDKTARVWNAASGAPEGALEGHEDTLWGPIFSPDRLRMLTFSRDKTARLWDLPSQQPNLGRPPEHSASPNE
jgi:WD40 repeat protein